MPDRDPTRGSPDIEDNEDDEEDEGKGKEKVELKDEKRERFLAELRNRGEERERQAKDSIDAIRAAARGAAGSTERTGLDFCLAGDRRNGGMAAIGVKTSEGRVETITKALGISKEKAAQLSFVYGRDLRVSLKKEMVGDSETDFATITIPLDLSPREFPFLVRETLRALGALETHVVSKTIGGGKEKGGKKRKQKLVQSEEPTIMAEMIRKEIEKRKKYEEGLEGLKNDFEQGEGMIGIRSKYRKLETEHSAAWCLAENQVNRLAEEKSQVFMGSTGFDLYEAYGSASEFKKEQLRRTMERQAQLIYPYDDNRTNLLLLGRPGTEAEKIQYLTFTGLFTGLWGPYWVKRAYHGRKWDIPFTDRLKPHLRDSTMVTDYMLRRRLRGYDEVGGSTDSFEKRVGMTGVDMVKTYGKAVGQLAGGVGILGLAATLELPFRAANSGVNWLDKKLYGLQKTFGNLVSKDYKPGSETLEEKETKRKKEYEALLKKAMGKQEEKSK